MDTHWTKRYAGDPAFFPATIPILDASDERAANLVSTALEGLADRTAALASPHTAALETFRRDDPTSSHAQIGEPCVRGYFTPSGVAVTLANGLKSGDVVEVRASCFAQLDTPDGSSPGTHRGYVTVGVGEESIACDIPELSVDVPASGDAQSIRGRVVYGPAYYVAAADIPGPLVVAVQARVSHDGDAVTVRAAANLVVTVYRWEP